MISAEALGLNLNISTEEIASLPLDEQRQLLKLVGEYETHVTRDRAQAGFLDFVHEVWPGFIHGKHHEIMADAFERVASGKLKRLIINMPPRHTKSEFASWLLPAWYLGKFPDRKVIQASHTAPLAVGFGRRVKNLVDSEDYQKIFDTRLAADAKAAGKWSTTQNGEYFAIGVGGNVAGKGAHVFIIDDPHSEQDYIDGQFNPDVWKKVYNWYMTGPRQRLQPGGAMVIVMTRWNKQDLTGALVKDFIQKEGAEWEIIELPAILGAGQIGDPTLWPEFWDPEEIYNLKRELPIGPWSAQYQQDPSSEEAALIKRDHWQVWDKDEPPECEATIIAWDTAFTKTELSNYSACTTWGVFKRVNEDGKKVNAVILLDAFKNKWEFPELKAVALQHYKDNMPDMFLIEKKSSGIPLVQELRRIGIPVQEYVPSRGQDKVSRVNSITDLFASGCVFAPETKWAEEVIEECASFPTGDQDDYVDSMSLALMRFRQGGWVGVPSDEDWDEKAPIRRREPFY